MRSVTQAVTGATQQAVVYVDMDHVLCDFMPTYLSYQTRYPDLQFPHSKPGFFLDIEPIPGATEAFRWLMEHERYDVYILTAPSVRNVHCYTEKRVWVEQHLGFDAAYRLIISPNKSLLLGDYLIDDNSSGKGQENFRGELIQFGSVRFPNWSTVISYLAQQN